MARGKWHSDSISFRRCAGVNCRSMAVALITAVCMCGISASAQTNRYLLQGNKYYEQQKYKEAADDYAKALKKDPNNTPGLFNMGNTLYQQKLYDSSRKIMSATEKMIKDKSGKAAANYNIGNTFMSQQKWDDAISAYKQTLRANPQDVDAKYNLSYAEEMRKKQQNQQNQDKKDKQNKDQQNKDNQNQQNKDQKDKQNKDQQNKDQKDQQDKEQQEQQGQQSKITKQDADNLLNALQQQEKKLQDKMNKEKGVPTKMDKDW